MRCTRKNELLEYLAASASNLKDRLDGDFEPVHSASSDTLLAARIKRWKDALDDSDGKLLSERRRAFRSRHASLRKLFGEVRLRKTAELPSWCADFDRLLLTPLRRRTPNSRRRRWYPPKDLPFGPLVARLINTATVDLRTCFDGVRAHRTSVFDSLIGILAEKVSALSLALFQAEFERFCASRGVWLLDRLINASLGGDPRQHYRAFIDSFNYACWCELFAAFPVWTRLLTLTIVQWQEQISLCAQRLAEDRSLIEKKFFRGGVLPQLISVRGDLGDSHRGGKSVLELEFQNGRSLMYKPRSLRIDLAYNSLLEWCNNRLSVHDLRAVSTIDRGEYGWCEKIPYRQCRSPARRLSFYRRLGRLLAVWHLLRGTDCHFENLIAHGEYPVLIDIESLLHEPAREFALPSGSNAIITAQRVLSDSVLRVGMLPVWQDPGESGRAYDMSALGGIGEQRAPFPQPRWRSINSDLMGLEQGEALVTRKQNEPSRAISVYDDQSIKAIITGFSEQYNLFRQECDSPSLRSVLSRFRTARSRYILRPTSCYGWFIERSIELDCLRSGIDRSLALERLAQWYFGENSYRRLAPLLDAEREALEQLDIPLFTVPCDGTSTNFNVRCTSDGSLAHPLGASPYRAVLDHFRLYSTNDLQIQLTIIESTLTSRNISCEFSRRVALHSRKRFLSEKAPGWDLIRAGEFAERIGEKLARDCIVGTDGSRSWIGFSQGRDERTYDLRAVGESLYQGNCGIALFFAALHAVTGKSRYRSIALGALAPTLGDFVQSDVHPWDTRPLGVSQGISGVALALAICSDLLRDRSLEDQARTILQGIEPSRISRERSVDFLQGIAGVLSVVTSICGTSATGLIESLATRLLELRDDGPLGSRTWKTLYGKRLAGFSHGAAGIALALYRAYRVTGNLALRAAATEAIMYEQSLYSETEKNWPDLRNELPSYDSFAWCHGAPGIGLAYLELCESSELAFIARPALEHAIASTLRRRTSPSDTLCCGAAGRTEFLLSAGEALGAQELIDDAQQDLGSIIERDSRGLPPRVVPHSDRTLPIPGLFNGIAGIGYQALRLSCPQVVPSILRFNRQPLVKSVEASRNGLVEGRVGLL